MSSRFYKKKKPRGLMLTSLLDMFTIILIFLIVSFEAEDQDFRLDSELTLPESAARSVFTPAVNVAINPQQLLVEREPIAELDNGRFDDEMYDQGEIEALVERLSQELGELDLGPGGDDEAIVMVQADKDLDYATLYLVMRSSSVAGFSRYRLVIMKE